MASGFPPREKHPVESLLRLSGLEPLAYQPDARDMRRTFLKIGERCNVAGSSIYKKAIVDGDFDKALGIAAKQARACQPQRRCPKLRRGRSCDAPSARVHTLRALCTVHRER